MTIEILIYMKDIVIVIVNQIR